MVQNGEEDVRASYYFDKNPTAVYRSEDVWDDIVKHSWEIADTIKRDARGNLNRAICSEDEPLPVPFLVCGEGHLDFNDITASFDKLEYEAMSVTTFHRDMCLLLSTNSAEGREVVDSFGGSLTSLPLPDVAKIHPGTIDEILSTGWSVPFGKKQVSNESNSTEMMNQWERMLIADLTPELSGLEEESELLEIVNVIMNDIQDMSEVGWYQKMEDEEEKRMYSLEETTENIPSLSDFFSLTAIASAKPDNQRFRFWQEVFKSGIESKHICSTMFSTLFVKARSGYSSFELVLNPMDGPPAQEYESSASNPKCVLSLVAALSAHPYVLSVKANFPAYHGWNVAQLVDSLK